MRDPMHPPFFYDRQQKPLFLPFFIPVLYCKSNLLCFRILFCYKGMKRSILKTGTQILIAREGEKAVKKLYYNGTILTMDEKNPTAAALAVEDDRILAVYQKVPTDWQDEKIDLNGKALLPGFIDGHSHFIGFANSLSQCDLAEAKNFDDIVSLMQDFIKKRSIPKGKWVIGVNYDQNFLEEKEHPDRHVLDRISPDHPIMITHISSHMGVVSSYGLEKQGITDAVQDPQGGRFGRFSDTDQLSGYMEENVFIDFQKAVSSFDLEELKRNIAEAQTIYAKYGITMIQDGMMPADLYPLLKMLAAEKLLKMDVVGYIDLAHCRSVYQEHPEDHTYHDHFRLGGYKIFLDGSPQGRTAWMKEPYLASEACGYPVHSNAELYELIEQALEDDAQLLAHCNGDAAADQYVTQFEKVVAKHQIKDTHRPVMIHAQLVQKKELQRMKALSMIPSFFVAHTYYWGDIHLANFGKERGARVSPVHDAIEAGLYYTFHQDTPVLLPDMMKTISCAVNRVTRNGVSLDQSQSISVLDALKAVTIYAAYQYGEEKDKGSLEKGKKANLIILDKNPLEVPKQELAQITVLETIVDGQVLYKARF